ncbi:HOG (high osmolarity glycerol) pathway protein [Umbelopsis nana]
MSLSSVFTLAFVLKKFAKKSSLRKQQKKHEQKSSCSNKLFASSSTIEPNITLKPSSSSTTRASAPAEYSASLSSSSQKSDTTLEEQSLDKTADTVAKPIEIPSSSTEEEQLEDLGPEDTSGKSWSASLAAASSLDASSVDSNTKGIQHVIVIRDYAYPASHPMHRGIPMSPILQTARPVSEVSLSSSEFTGRQAKALYDFEPESESECAMRAGDIIWVQYRQCQGWLVADVGDETGLVPEEFVEWV